MGSGQCLQPVHGAMGPLSVPVGVAVGNEAALEQRLHQVAQRMVDHPVGEGRGTDPPALRLGDLEVDIGVGPPASVEQFGLQRQQAVCRLVLEGRRSRCSPLAPRGLAPG